MSGRLFVIGDIHGCAAELETLIDALPLGAGDTLACLGDYCDRGADTRQVIDLLIEVARRPDLKTVFLCGNHEDMWLAYLGRDGRWPEAWIDNGGDATLESYGVDPRARGAELAAALPVAHLQFLERLQVVHQTSSHLLVHAGVKPGRSLAEQDREDLLWIREPFLHTPHGLAQTVVYGHTPSREIAVDLPYKIGIDTGCVYGGRLTCLAPEEARAWQVDRGQRTVTERALPPNRRRS